MNKIYVTKVLAANYVKNVDFMQWLSILLKKVYNVVDLIKSKRKEDYI